MFLHAITPKVASPVVWAGQRPQMRIRRRRSQVESVHLYAKDHRGSALALYPKPPCSEKTVMESMLVGWWPIVPNSYRPESQLKWDPAQKYLTLSFGTSEIFKLWYIENHPTIYLADTLVSNTTGVEICLIFRAYFFCSISPRNL